MNLGPIRKNRPRASVDLLFYFDRCRDRSPNKLKNLADNGSDIQYFLLSLTLPAEQQNLLHQMLGPVSGSADLLNICV